MSLLLGSYLEVLGDREFDALITDPPYGMKTHRGSERMIHQQADGADRRAINYQHWDAEDVESLVVWADSRCRGWICCMTSDDLIPAYRDSFEMVCRYHFAPVVIRQPRCRLTGDGPASEAVYMMVSRPKTTEFSRWGALPGWYDATIERGAHIGGKPLGLMRAIVGHYTMPGHLVCDPCAGYGTTLVAADQLGCLAIGAEIDKDTAQVAGARIRNNKTHYPHPRLTKSTPKLSQEEMF